MISEFPRYAALVKEGPFPSDRILADALFKDALQESFAHHYQNCAAFSQYCRNRSWNGDTIISDIEEFPYIPVQAFKLYGKDLLRTSTPDEKSFFMHSSATSGQPSSINVTRSAAKRQTGAMASVVSSFLGTKKRPFVIFDVNPGRSISGEVGARYGATVGYMSFSNEAHFVLKENKFGEIELDQQALHAAVDAIVEGDQAPVIFGFTYVLYDVLKNYFQSGPMANFKNGTILHIGGWKKLEAQKISKYDFNDQISRIFGLYSGDVIDAYGFTEQMGINHLSAGDDDKVAPNFVRVLVRDPETLEVLPDGKEGLLQFISPLPLSYPGISVLTDDLGIVTKRFDTISGRHGTAFRVTGRAKNAEVRGCGDIMSSYLARPNEVVEAGQQKILPPKMMFFEQSCVPKSALHTFIDLDALPEVESLDKMCDRLRENREALDAYSVDDLIGFFAIASRSWLDPSSPMRHLQQHGLSFLVNWLQADNLRSIANKSLKGSRLSLDRFVPDAEFPGRQLHAVPRGIVGHWLAGNVPLLGMLGLVQSVLTKNANILRVPASNTAVMPVIMDVLAQSIVTLPNGVSVNGSDIAKTIAILYYDKLDHRFGQALSRSCDARVAWGGAEAVAAVSALPAKIDCQTVVYGPKLSFMAISGEMLDPSKNVDKLFRRIAVDCSVFDQYACASPHTIFVERNPFVDPEEFCGRLSVHMENVAQRIPKQPADPGTASNVIANRIKHDFLGKIWQSAGTTWTIALEAERVGLAHPVYSRFVTVVFLDEIVQAASFASHDVQTVALSMPESKKIAFAKIAARHGAMRFPDIGRMTHFESPWDGVFMMDRLVRFVSLGGPLV